MLNWINQVNCTRIYRDVLAGLKCEVTILSTFVCYFYLALYFSHSGIGPVCALMWVPAQNAPRQRTSRASAPLRAAWLTCGRGRGRAGGIGDGLYKLKYEPLIGMPHYGMIRSMRWTIRLVSGFMPQKTTARLHSYLVDKSFALVSNNLRDTLERHPRIVSYQEQKYGCLINKLSRNSDSRGSKRVLKRVN